MKRHPREERPLSPAPPLLQAPLRESYLQGGISLTHPLSLSSILPSIALFIASRQYCDNEYSHPSLCKYDPSYYDCTAVKFIVPL